MKRAGFTMIELIFVIVILGILSAVALPKFIGISEQAQGQKCAAMVGTLNRTVGPSLWAKGMASSPMDFNITQADIVEQMEFGADLNTTCAPAGVIPANGATGTVTKGSMGQVTYHEGNTSTAPSWDWNASY